MPVNIKRLGVDFSDVDLGSALREVAQGVIESDGDTKELVVVFMTEADERVRPEHAALHGTVWDADDPNRPIPPLGHGCRCWEEVREKKGANLGLETEPSNPPEAGDEALEQFWQEAEQSDKSATTGEPVTPQDTFGKTTGKAIEDKKIKPDEAIDEDTGDKRPVSEVRGLATAKASGFTRRQVLVAFTDLMGFAISPSMQARVIALARQIKKAKPTLKDEQALFSALLKIKPGRVGAATGAQTRKNARSVAKSIRRAAGPL